MQNQPNEMVVLEWLLPLFAQQSALLTTAWQVNADDDVSFDAVDFDIVVQHYQQLSGALVMVKLPCLAAIADRLKSLAAVASRARLSAEQCRLAQFAQQLLQYELIQYQQSACYRAVLVRRTVAALTQSLASITQLPEQITDLQGQSIAIKLPLIDSAYALSSFKLDMSAALSKMPLSVTTLQAQHYQQLLTVWQQQLQSLLTENSNQPSILAALAKVSQYLWQGTDVDLQRQLWYVTELWLHNLADNSQPLLQYYAAILADLEQLIIAYSLSFAAELTQTVISTEVLENLSADIYIQLSSLPVINSHAQAVLSHVLQSNEPSLRFFPRILSEIEAVIFALDQPLSLSVALQHIKTQLAVRGWTQYELQVAQILVELERNIDPASRFLQIQWQIEQQLQELYSAIYHTEQAINNHIGAKPEAVTAAHNPLYQLRVAIGDIRQCFNNYVQQRQPHLLPAAAVFSKVSLTFDEMGLISVRQVTDKLGALFSQLITENIDILSADLAEALATSLCALELFIDYLAQQIFAQSLLTQAHQQIDSATQLLRYLMANPLSSADKRMLGTTQSLNNVLRYDDTGAVIATTEGISANTNPQVAGVIDSVKLRADEQGSVIVSGELLAVCSQFQPDRFETDNETGAEFFRQVTAINADLDDFLAIWQQDPQDFTPLMEIRDGFYQLKFLGRAAGALSISEIAWAIENLLNAALAETTAITAEVVSLVTHVSQSLAALLADFIAQRPPTIKPALIIEQTNTLLSGQPLTHLAEKLVAAEKLSISERLMLSVIGPFIAQAEQLPVDTQDADPDIKAIFIEEAREVLALLQKLYRRWLQTPEILTLLIDIRRGFHTLKGSGQMVGAHYTSELAWSIENMLNRILDHSINLSIDIVELIGDVVHGYPELIEKFAEDSYKQLNSVKDQRYSDPVCLWVACARAYSKCLGAEFSYVHLRSQWLQRSHFPQQEIASTTTENISSIALEADEGHSSSLYDNNANGNDVNGNDFYDDDAIDSALQERVLQTVYAMNEIMAEASVLIPDASLEEQAFAKVFIDEAQALLQVINDFIASHAEQAQIAVSDSIVRAFHTLRSASGSTTLVAIGQLSATIEHSLEQLQQQDIMMTAQHLQALAQSTLLIQRYLNAYKQSLQPQSQKIQQQSLLTDTNITHLQDWRSLQTIIDQEKDPSAAPNNQLNIAQLLRLDIDALLDAERYLQTALNTPDLVAIQAYIQQQRQQIACLAIQTTDSAKFSSILSALDAAYDYLSQHPEIADSEAIQTALLAGHAQLLGLFDALAGSMSLKIDPQVLADLQQLLPQQTESLVDSTPADVDPEIDIVATVVSLDSLIESSWLDGLPDPDILEVFVEEAQELIANSNRYLQLFLSNVTAAEALQELQRDLHTLKGGARMLAVSSIADLAHQMETLYEALAIQRLPVTETLSQLLIACHDWLADEVFVLKHQLKTPLPLLLLQALQQFSNHPDSLNSVPIESLQTQLNAILAAQNKGAIGDKSVDIKQMPLAAGHFAEQPQASSDETLRVSGNLIERMINLSGESAINRTRIDMSMSGLSNSIKEMGTTVQRLSDQLRRMEIELETQILSQLDETVLIANADFDPLEMDRYSSLNQLSKSLTESASDLVEINSTLLSKTRASEHLLLQLSRMQTELQDGLMSSRMVPFACLTPRLERIVRQTSHELNKSVVLTVINADGEMDKTILERITSPLEHMLRNAVDHGIEYPQTRLNAGKKRSGHIILEILREGGEVVIHLSDDGCGIDVQTVRKQAISQGLIAAHDDSLSEFDIMQYIFHAGLSTSKQVTQISGRGVGMDVVISEIRQLGGVVSVSSEAGLGSKFTLRVPFTVAIADALVVRVAACHYAIPLTQIERVVRLNPKNLYDYYQSGHVTLDIEGRDYRVRYLDDILSGNKLDKLTVATNSSLPVIMVKNRSGQSLALQVDQIVGSRIEVVVKPLGRQLAHLTGIAAATIMGDGSVMLILDLPALLRYASLVSSKPDLQNLAFNASSTAHKTAQQCTVLVVDDSVTVRKVTSRLLERQGLTALVATDGLDAMEVMQKLTPDLILLDIEMPRMDGFEVASQVRRHKRLQQVPIIMITSRTGDKHRDRALEVGVNAYMGKPFQEHELLAKIEDLLTAKTNLTYAR